MIVCGLTVTMEIRVIINDAGRVSSAAHSARYLILIFNTAFSGCQAAFAFENATIAAMQLVRSELRT